MKIKIAIIFFFIILLSGAVYLIKNSDNAPLTKQEAIEQAKAYSPGEMICTDALVPAVHTATGAKYTFSSGCLAPGWEPDR